MALNFLLLIVGLVLLLGGGDLLVRGASSLARSFGVSPLIIGLTVVAFGTSAPEFSVNFLAAIQGDTDISFGNIIGSNIANIGLIIGLTAMIRPLAIKEIIITREIPMMLFASFIALITGMDIFLRNLPNFFDRSEGLIFLLIFCVFLFYTISDIIRKRENGQFFDQTEEKVKKKSFNRIICNLFIFITGLILLIFGGKITVDAAVAVAELLYVPQVIIGLTIIAIGTSLPELVTSVIATLKGQTDIAIGNIVGSNIFNLLLVNGCCATLRPIRIPIAGGAQDLWMMVILSFFLFLFCITDKRKILRWEGALLLTLYSGFNLWRINSG
jgi:cation:H+ antiporter